MPAPRRFLPSIPALRALEAVDRLGSATAAAEELSLSQSAVSRQLQALEAQVGVPLVQRAGRRMQLTGTAQRYAGEVRGALQKIAQATLQAQVQADGGTLNLAILPTFGMRWLVPRLSEFARRHPEVTINMTTRIERFNFDAEPYDAAIHFGTGDWPGTAKLRLKSERVVAVCAPSLLEGRAIGSARDLAALPLLRIRSRPDAWPEWLAAHGAPDMAGTGMVYDQFATITQAALHGLGVALLPDYLAEPDIAAGRLVVAWGAATESAGAYYLVWPKENTDAPALGAFRDWLSGQAEDDDPLPR